MTRPLRARDRQVGRSRLRRVLALHLVLAAAACGSTPTDDAPAQPAPPAADPTSEEWDREIAGVQLRDVEDTDPAGTVTVLPFRVLDEATGEGIAGARIDNWDESDTPHAEPWDDLRAGSWTTDRDGWALVPAFDRAPWWFVAAPGYGPRAEMGFEDQRPLRRGVDFPIEVRDWRDRPVPGAIVEALLGCGHTPNIRVATAGPDGRLTLPCIDPSHATDLWVRTPGLTGRNDAYWGGGPEVLPVERGIHVIRGDPSAVLEGRVLRPDGTPARGAVVGTRSAHRGPWTVADADGRFRLVGAHTYDGLIAQAPYSDPVVEGFHRPATEFQTVPGVVATVTLPAEGKRRLTRDEMEAERARRQAERDARDERKAKGIEEPEPEVPPNAPGIRVRISAAPGTLPRGTVFVVLVRASDGAAVLSYPRFRDGVAARAVPVGSGEWTVTAGGPTSALRPASKRVEVGEGWSEAEFVLDANPTWRPRWAERAADGTERELAAAPAGKYEVVTDDGVDDATPATDATGAPDGSIHIPAEGPFAVRFRADDGWKTQVVFDGPPRGDGRALVAPVVTPEEPDKSSDADAEPPREFAPARLTVLLRDGSPAAGASVAIHTPPRITGPPLRLVRAEERDVELDEHGSAQTGFDRGERVVVSQETEDDSEVVLPLTARIDGPGPWMLRWPDTEVTVRATDEKGAPLTEFEVRLEGWSSLEPKDGVVRILGAASGPLRFWVDAPGRKMHDLRLVLTAGEKREVVVRLNPVR
jgi:hypothetical protein